jgi:hypothetical protein
MLSPLIICEVVQGGLNNGICQYRSIYFIRLNY